MEAAFTRIASMVALAIESVMVLVLIAGTLQALAATVRQIVARRGVRSILRETWLRYAAWIVLALEFALAADLIRTVVTPSWNEIGKLATIGAIRTALNYFLSHDIGAFRDAERAAGENDPLGTIPRAPSG